MAAVYTLLFVLNPLTILLAVVLSRRVVQGEMMSEVQVLVDSITAQLVKVRDEVVGEISKLEESLAAGVAPDLSALKAAADALDAIVPDAVVEVEEAAVEVVEAEVVVEDDVVVDDVVVEAEETPAP